MTPQAMHPRLAEIVTACSRLVLSAVASALTLGVATATAAVYQPIATSGHDADIVYEVGLSAGQSGANNEIGSRQFYEHGVATQTAAHKPGLPRTVSGLTTTGGNTLNYTFEPFELNNVLKFGPGTPARSLTLEAPATFSNLAVVLSAGSLNADAGAGPLETAIIPYTVNYAGGLTQTGVLRSADWSIRGTPASNRTEKLLSVGRTGAATAPLWPQTPETDSQPDRWNVFFQQIALDHEEANLLSVSFGPVTLDDADGQLNADDDVVIFGLSGVPFVVPSLTVEVNAATGLVQFRNATDAALSLTGYEITSAAGSLRVSGWNSLADQNLNPVDGPDAGTTAGDSPGESWAEAAGSSAFALQEGFLLGSATVGAGESLPIGLAYNSSIDARDLVATVRNADSTIVPLVVEYVESAPPGDFDGDLDVDGDDLAVWRSNFGSTSATPLHGDADGDADVDGADFLVWQQHVSPLDAAVHTTVPEPLTRLTAALAAFAAFIAGRGKRINPARSQLNRSLYFLR